MSEKVILIIHQLTDVSPLTAYLQNIHTGTHIDREIRERFYI